MFAATGGRRHTWPTSRPKTHPPPGFSKSNRGPPGESAWPLCHVLRGRCQGWGPRPPRKQRRLRHGTVYRGLLAGAPRWKHGCRPTAASVLWGGSVRRCVRCHPRPGIGQVSEVGSPRQPFARLEKQACAQDHPCGTRRHLGQRFARGQPLFCSDRYFSKVIGEAGHGTAAAAGAGQHHQGRPRRAAARCSLERGYCHQTQGKTGRCR